MCRIVGHLDRDVPEERLLRICSMLRHGGPDGSAVSHGTGWGLGATRLAIMDPEGGAQPYRLGEIRVVFNGEIYNHHELRRWLMSRGYQFHDRCDGSVIAPLFLEYGDDLFPHLDGMYAIAIVDLRGEPRLTLATDGFGIKPLYYTVCGDGGLCFASEIGALLAFPGVNGAIWESALESYLTTKTVLGERTCYRDIRVLPPSSLLTYSRSAGVRIRRRPWTYPQEETEMELQHAAAAVRASLRDEVHRLARADVPVAAICSGGLDSSLATTLLAELPGTATAFHIGYGPGWPKDELRFARMVTQMCGAGLHEVRLDPRDMPELLPAAVGHLGQPNADPIVLSTLALFRAVNAAGFKAVISGDGADEFFGGYERIKVAMSAPVSRWTESYLDSVAAVPAGMRESLYTPDYRAHARDVGTAAQIREALRDNGSSRLTAITKWEVGQRLPAYHLRRVDHLSMASAVEVRVPYCQQAIARLALGLPERLRVCGGQVKRALYGAGEGLLPEEVLRRPKQPFTLPIEAMLRDGGPLLDYVRAVLSASELRPAGQLDPLAVKSLLAEHGRRPTSVTALALWALMIFQVWLQGGHHETGSNRLR